MRRSLVVAFAVVATLLAVSAMPVQAQNASAVASSHTTFGTGDGEPDPVKTTNMTIEGSGESASVALQTGSESTAGITSESTDTSSGAADSGLKINPNKDLSAIEVGVDPDTTGFDGIEIETTDGTVVADKTVSPGNGPYLIEASLESGTSYYVSPTNPDQLGVVSTSPSFPYESSNVDITANLYNGFEGTSDYEGLTTITGIVSGGDSGTYISAPHDANADTGWTNLSLTNASATVYWQEDANGDGSWTNVTSTEYTTGGNKTVDLTGTTSDRWRVRIDIETTGDSPVAEIHDEGLLFEPSSPVLSDPDPADGSQISSYDGDVSVNLSDADFRLAQGDNVTVTATNGSGGQIGQQTLSANGTVSFQYDALAGENQIDWQATDEYGNSDSFSQTFTTPSQLIVKNKSDPDQTISAAGEIAATFFGGDGETVVERTSSDGTFDLSGLPADTEYIVQVDADGYRSRQVIITSLFDQQTIYLLPESANAAQIEYVLDDKTGQFPQESTRLFVDAAIKVNGTTTFKTLLADEFGASGSLRVTLRDNTRYRVRVRNADGDERVLGSYTTSGADTVTLEIGQLRFAVGDSPDTFNVSATTVENQNGTVEAVNFNYRDPQDATTRINVSVETLNGTVLGQDVATGTYGNYSFRQDVNNSTARNNTFVVVYELTRNGETISGQLRPGLNRYPPGVPLDGGLKQLFSVGMLIMVGGLFSATNARVGAVVTPLFAAGLWYVKWLPPGTSILAIALALGVGVLVNYGDRR